MIVLAIAGLIMLIVFLAVPALQAAGRNNQRRADVSAIAAAIAEYADENGGLIPNAIASSTTYTNMLYFGCNGAKLVREVPGGDDSFSLNSDRTVCDTSDTNYTTAKIGFYDPSLSGYQHNPNIFFGNTPAEGLSSSPIPTSEANESSAINMYGLLIMNGYGCNNTETFIDPSDANPNVASILYVSENSGNGSMECVQAY
jgi:type II secretory pathway pseudopilin PulG